jgi:PIN domain nuclease of toxin-antitoxin system
MSSKVGGSPDAWRDRDDGPPVAASWQQKLATAIQTPAGDTHASSGALANQGFTELPITVPHGQRSGSLPGPHRDPFDRMLIAQAAMADLILVSDEAVFDRYAVRRLW